MRSGETDGGLSEPLRSYASQAGLVMRRPPKVPYTVYALEATEHAQRHGVFDSFHHEMYRAYWEHGQDLGDTEVIRDVALSCGLDWPDLKDKLESRYYRQTVVDQFRAGVDLGINGIPGFLIGNVLFTGARPYEVFKTVAEKVLGEREQAEGRE